MDPPQSSDIACRLRNGVPVACRHGKRVASVAKWAVATPLEHAIEDMADVDVVKHFVDNLVDTAASDLHDSIDLCELDSRDATDRGSQHNAIDWHRYINDIISKHGTPRNPSSRTVTPDED